MPDLEQIAAAVDEAVLDVDGVEHVYSARPPARSLAAAITGKGSRAHVREHPTQRVDIAIGVPYAADVRAVAAAVAASARASLPAEWSSAAVEVQVRRVTT